MLYIFLAQRRIILISHVVIDLTSFHQESATEVAQTGIDRIASFSTACR